MIPGTTVSGNNPALSSAQTVDINKLLPQNTPVQVKVVDSRPAPDNSGNQRLTLQVGNQSIQVDSKEGVKPGTTLIATRTGDGNVALQPPANATTRPQISTPVPAQPTTQLPDKVEIRPVNPQTPPITRPTTGTVIESKPPIASETAKPAPPTSNAAQPLAPAASLPPRSTAVQTLLKLTTQLASTTTHSSAPTPPRASTTAAGTPSSAPAATSTSGQNSAPQPAPPQTSQTTPAASSATGSAQTSAATSTPATRTPATGAPQVMPPASPPAPQAQPATQASQTTAAAQATPPTPPNSGASGTPATPPAQAQTAPGTSSTPSQPSSLATPSSPPVDRANAPQSTTAQTVTAGTTPAVPARPTTPPSATTPPPTHSSSNAPSSPSSVTSTAVQTQQPASPSPVPVSGPSHTAGQPTVTTTTPQSAPSQATTPNRPVAGAQAAPQPATTTPGPTPSASQPTTPLTATASSQGSTTAASGNNAQAASQAPPQTAKISAARPAPHTAPATATTASPASTGSSYTATTNHQITIRLADGPTVQFSSPQTITTGTRLMLTPQPGGAVQAQALTATTQSPLSPAEQTQINDKLRQTMPQQLPTADGFNSLQQLTSTPEMTTRPQMNNAVRSLLSLFGVAPGSSDSAAQVKQNVEMGGRMTEAHMMQGRPVGRDMKLALRQLKHLSEQLPDAARSQLDQLIQKLQARQTSQQLQALQQWKETPEGTLERVIRTDLPVRQGDQYENVELTITEQQQQDESSRFTSQWRVQLQFDLERKGHVMAELVMQHDEQLSGSFWVERRETAAEIRQKLTEFTRHLGEHGFEVSELHCHLGKPSNSRESISHQLIDLKT